MDIRKGARVLARAAAAVVGIAIAAYVVLVIVNWNDESPSAQARAFQAAIATRPAVADAENGAVHLLGLDAPRGADALALGASRRAWLEEPATAKVPVLPPGGMPHPDLSLPPQVRAVLRACRARTPECIDTLASSEASIDAWLDAHADLLTRYRRMLATPRWREILPGDPRRVVTSAGSALDLQALHLLDARRRAAAGDAEGTRTLLDADLAFWRRALAESDSLIGKVIAASAVQRHFALGGLALRSLPREAVGAATPEDWARAINAAERSLRRAYAGEWHLNALIAYGGGGADARDHAGRAAESLLRPLFKPQATLNRFAARTDAIARVSELPPAEVGPALSDLARRTEAEPPMFRVYNPVGTMLDAIAAPGQSRYVARVADVEAHRRAELLALRLHVDGIGSGAAPAAVAASALREPALGAAFDWDAAAGAIVFTGLHAEAHAPHRIFR